MKKVNNMNTMMAVMVMVALTACGQKQQPQFGAQNNVQFTNTGTGQSTATEKQASNGDVIVDAPAKKSDCTKLDLEGKWTETQNILDTTQTAAANGVPAHQMYVNGQLVPATIINGNLVPATFAADAAKNAAASTEGTSTIARARDGVNYRETNEVVSTASNSDSKTTSHAKLSVDQSKCVMMQKVSSKYYTDYSQKYPAGPREFSKAARYYLITDLQGSGEDVTALTLLTCVDASCAKVKLNESVTLEKAGN